MMISEEQARLALAVLQNQRGSGDNRIEPTSRVTPELFERVLAALQTMPETRAERIAEARTLLDGPGPTAREVATKIVDRMISDSIR